MTEGFTTVGYGFLHSGERFCEGELDPDFDVFSLDTPGPSSGSIPIETSAEKGLEDI